MKEHRLKATLPRSVVLRDPLLLASGCCGYGGEWSELVDPASIGGVITKAVSIAPRKGNPVPRLRETPAGLLNSIGLQNPGVEYFVANTLPSLAQRSLTYIVNVVGHTPADFAAVIERIESSRRHAAPAIDGKVTTGFTGYELDLSCPNVESGTMFATDVTVLAQTVALCRGNTSALLIAKLSPNVTDIVPFAEAAATNGADAVTVANTWMGMSIDIQTRRSHLGRPSAGLSGPAIRPATLYHVWKCHRALPELPIIASGGITDTDSAVQYLLAGATALQLGTGLFYNPHLPLEIQQGLVDYLDTQQVASLDLIIGTFTD